MANTRYSILDNASHVQISGGTFNMGPSAADVREDAARDLLAKHIAPNALPDSDAMYDGPKCYPQTRKAINRKLGRWIRQQDDVDTKFIWLQGGAGAGKSAIMRTTALGGPGKQDNPASNSDVDTDMDMDTYADTNTNLDSALDPDLDSDDSDKPHVLGSFFFSRQDSTRNTARSLIPTLALQLCDAHPAAKNIILQTISAKRELIFTTSILNQVRALLVRPLAHLERECRWLSQADKVQDESQPGRVFIIDGLDECAEPKKQSEVIEALAVLVKELPVRVLLASRPDEPIPSAIRHCFSLRGIFSEICLSDDPNSSSDIRLFLEESLREVRRRYISLHHGSLPNPWPTEEDVRRLVWKSSEHFIYASTAEKYISSGVERPDIALRVILDLQVPRTGHPFEELDALYLFILEKARFRKEVLEILSLTLFEQRTNAGGIGYLLGYPLCDICHFLSDMSAIVIIDKYNRICWRHKSFSDFLQDKARAQEFYIGTSAQFHRNHLGHYFTVLNKYLATSNANLNSPLLVWRIADGIKASPLSDTTTALIIQHPLPIVYNFLLLVPFCDDYEDTVCGKYIQAIAHYDAKNSCAVYQDCLKDIIYHYKETPDSPDPDNNLDLGSIFIPLLLVGLDIYALKSIYKLAGVKGKLWPILIAFGKIDNNFLCRLHHHPVHILRQIREEMVDADNDLEAATLKMLQMVTKYNCYDLYDTGQGLLKAVAFVLPKIAYRHDIAFYAASQLPDPLDIDHIWCYDHDKFKRAIRRARKAMDVYLRRGEHPAIGANTGDSEINNGYGMEIVGSSSSEEEEASSALRHYTIYYGPEEMCSICKKIWGEEIE